jgi:transcriptional regulator with XRE-family HTH domain
MNEIQSSIAELENKGWTLAALADELGVTVNTVEKWKAGTTSPANSKATLYLLHAIAQKKQIPKKKRYIHGSRMKVIIGSDKQMEQLANPRDIMSPIGIGESIPSSESLPMYIAKKWGFPLEHQEVDETDLYCIKDWIAGLTGDQDRRANHIWWNFKKAHINEGGILSRERVYHGTSGKTYPMDFTNDEGLYKLAMWLRVTQRRTALKAIKTFLAKAGVFVDEARRDPETASEKLAIDRRSKALQSGKTEDWIATRELGVITRKLFVSRIYDLVQDKKAFGVIIGAITNDVYRGIFNSDVSGLRKRLGISSKENPRDNFSRIALAYTTIAEESVKVHLSNYSDRDFVPVHVIRDVVDTISSAIGVQADLIARALEIDIVTGRKLIEGKVTQGKFDSILKEAKRKRLSTEDS